MQNLLNYRVFGNGHPVVFLHGFLEDLSMWEFLTSQQNPFHAICIDLPGHGLSQLTDDSPSLEFMAGEVLKVVDYLKLSEFHIVGHSMGGYVALLIKEKRKKCQKIVLLNSNFWEDTPEKKLDRIRVADIVFQAKELFLNVAIPGLFYRYSPDELAVKALRKIANQCQPEAIAYAALAMRERKHQLQTLLNFPSDFLILQGEDDPLITKEKMDEELKGLAIKIVEIKNAGHMAHTENPSDTALLLIDFLTD
jgi:pimeloyl-ACP methyl ester carboxylesterase